MNSPLEIHAAAYKRNGFIRSFKIAFEILVYCSFLMAIASYHKFKQEWLFFIPLAVFLLLYIVKDSLKKLVSEELVTNLFITIFIVIFDKIDTIDITRALHLPILDKLPLPTVLLSIATLFYLLRATVQGTYVVRINLFGRNFSISCLFILTTALLFYAVLYFQYRINAQAAVLLFNKLIKYCILFLLFQEFVKGFDIVKRLSIGLLICLTTILALSAAF